MKNKINNKGFTLIELLVVVLIIGILAAIALPQYRIAVGKAKFSTLKNLTRTVWDSAQRYYLVNNTYPQTTTDLDIGLNIKEEKYIDKKYLEFTTTDDINCTIWDKNPTNFIACGKTILGKSIRLYLKSNGSPDTCLVMSNDKNDAANKLCKKETGNAGACPTGQLYCNYYY